MMMFETLRELLQQSIENYQTSPRSKTWGGPVAQTLKNEYNGILDVIDRSPLITDAVGPQWTFDYNKKYPTNMITDNFRFRNSTLNWLAPDSKSHYNGAIQDPAKKARLEEFGWINTEINYHFNNNGFRYDGRQGSSDFLSEQGGVLYLGCSTTFGVGVNIEDTWSWKLHHRNEKTKKLRYMNFGLPGHGVETYYRILKSYIGIVKPDMVVVTYPWASSRAEIFNPNLGEWINIWMSTKFGHLPVLMTDQQEKDPEKMDYLTRLALWSAEVSMIRYLKHHDAIRWMCHENDTKLVWMTMAELATLISALRKKPDWVVDRARDLMHQGRNSHEMLSIEIEEKVDACL